MGYWFTVHHRSAAMNGDADALSRLALDFSIDPTLNDYYKLPFDLNKKYPCVTGDVQPNNLPGFRRNFKNKQAGKSPTSTPAKAAYLNVASNNAIINSLTNVPIVTSPITSTDDLDPSTFCSSLNFQPIIANNLQAIKFDWIVNRFGSGSFFSICKEFNIPFSIPIACNITLEGRSLLQELGNAAKVVNGSLELLELIQLYMRPIQGYFAMSNNTQSRNEEVEFLKTQAKIINVLRRRCQLTMIIVHLHIGIRDSSKKEFITFLKSTNWIITEKIIHYPDFNDAIDDSACFIIGINSSRVGPDLDHPLEILRPPSKMNSIQDHILAEFNLECYAIILCPELMDESISTGALKLSHILSNNVKSPPNKCRFTHHLHHITQNYNDEVGCRVCDTHYPASPLEPKNNNIFQHLFGIRFQDNNKDWIRSISSYEFCSCFGLIKEFKHKIASNASLTNLLHRGCPARMVHSIL